MSPRPLGEAGDTDELVERLEYFGKHCLDQFNPHREAVLQAAVALTSLRAERDEARAQFDLAERSDRSARDMLNDAESSLAAEKQRVDDLTLERDTARTERRQAIATIEASEQRVVELTAERDARDAAEQEARLQNDREWRAKLDRARDLGMAYSKDAKEAEAALAAAETQMRAIREALDELDESEIESIVLLTESEVDTIWTRRIAVAIRRRIDAALAPVTTPLEQGDDMMYRLRMALISLLAGGDAVALNLTLGGAIHSDDKPILCRGLRWNSRYPNVGIIEWREAEKSARQGASAHYASGSATNPTAAPGGQRFSPSKIRALSRTTPAMMIADIASPKPAVAPSPRSPVMTKAAELIARAKRLSVELRGEMPRNNFGNASVVGLALLNDDASELLDTSATLLASQEAEIAKLRGALDAIEEIPDYSVSDYEKIRLILFAVKRARAALRPAETGDGQP